PDGQYLATAALDRRLLSSWPPTAEKMHDPVTIRIWHVAERREVHRLPGHKWGIGALAWSPDGRQLASAACNGFVKIWDTRGWREIFSLRGLPNQGESCLVWAPDGKHLASADANGAVKVWDALTGQEVLVIRGPPCTISGPWTAVRIVLLSWSPNSLWLALAATMDETITIWDAATGQLTTTVQAKGTKVASVAWSPDSRRVVAERGDV